MSQSRTSSLTEQVLNVASGFLISWAIWVTVITKVYNIQVSTYDNLSITLIFTVVSLVRGYCWRRLFNRTKK